MYADVLHIFQPCVKLAKLSASFLCRVHAASTVLPRKLILNAAFSPRMLRRLSICRASQLCSEAYLTEMSRPQTAPTMEPVSAAVDHLSLGLSDRRVDGSSGLEAAAASAWCGCVLKPLQHRYKVYSQSLSTGVDGSLAEHGTVKHLHFYLMYKITTRGKCIQKAPCRLYKLL